MPPGPRARLVDATIQLVRERGVHGAGLADVLERSGTARGSVYQHFPEGKGQLVAQAVRVAGDHLESLMARHDEPVAMVDALLAWWSLEIDRHGGHRGCPVAAAAVDPDPAVQAAALEVFERLHRRLTAAIGDVADASSRAGFVLSAVEGAILRARVSGDTAALDEVRHHLRAVLA